MKIELSKREYVHYLKQSNEWWDKRYDMIVKLTELKRLSYDKKGEVVLDWVNSTEEEQYYMRRYKDYDTYHNQLQKLLKG